jgi:hypothetical protein
VTSLTLVRLYVEETLNPAEAARDLSASIAANTSIKVLDCARYCRPDQAIYFAAIFRGLAEHTQIQKLIWNKYWHDWGITVAEADALQLALTATTATLEHLEFRNVDFEEETFSVIVQGIRKSRSVWEILLSRSCSFDEGSTLLLQELLTTPTDKRSLSVGEGW